MSRRRVFFIYTIFKNPSDYNDNFECMSSVNYQYLNKFNAEYLTKNNEHLMNDPVFKDVIWKAYNVLSNYPIIYTQLIKKRESFISSEKSLK